MDDDNQIDDSLMKSIYEYIPKSLSQSVYKTKDNIKSTINLTLNNTLSKINQIKTNIIYNMKHSQIKIVPIIHRQEIIIKQGTSAQLLGQIYTKQNDYKFLFTYRNTFWFTYRQGIKQIESDNGWGCMIRTVQMVLAQTIARNLKLKYTQQDQYKIIHHFSQNNQGVLSLYQICKEGKIDKRWTSSVQILSIVKRIILKNPQHFNFKMQMLSSGISYKNIEDQLFEDYPVLVNLSNRVSIGSIPQQFHKHYFQMMNHTSWVGSIGGIKGQALYIIGSYENKVIFLDPHYVQSNDEQLQVETYFNKIPRGIQISQLSPSLTFCYLIQSKQEHLKWIQWLSKLTEKYYPNVIYQYFDQQTKIRLTQADKSIEPSQSNNSIVLMSSAELKMEQVSQQQKQQLKQLQDVDNIQIVQVGIDDDDFQIL